MLKTEIYKLIKYIKHNQIDKIKWDDCIKQSFNGNIYVYSWYLDLIHESWDALIEDDYQRVMPLTLKTKNGITYYFQPYFTQQFGVFSKRILNPDIVDNFIKNIPKHVKIIDINLNSYNKLDDESYDINLNANYLLDLISGYQKLYLQYSTNTKRNLKKSIKNNLTFMKGVKPETVIKIFRDNKGADITKWSDSNYLVFQRVMYTAIHKGMGFSCGVYTEHNELCAAAFFMNTGNRLTFLFSGTNELARTNGAMSMLIDTIIRDNSETSKILDFEGSNNQNLARFYKGFGAKKTTYIGLKINRLNIFLKILLNAYRRLAN